MFAIFFESPCFLSRGFYICIGKQEPQYTVPDTPVLLGGGVFYAYVNFLHRKFA